MGDYSGVWAFDVGLPASRSISGAIMVIIPNVLGMCCYSPFLDNRGNSVRGVEFCKRLSARFHLHIFKHLVGGEKLGEHEHHDASKAQEKAMAAIMATIQAAAEGDTHALQEMVREGASMTVADYDYRTPLHLACGEGHWHTALFLLANGADPSAADRWGNTPLIDAQRGETEVHADLEVLLTMFEDAQQSEGHLSKRLVFETIRAAEERRGNRPQKGTSEQSLVV
jgi:glutaminase